MTSCFNPTFFPAAVSRPRWHLARGGCGSRATTVTQQANPGRHGIFGNRMDHTDLHINSQEFMSIHEYGEIIDLYKSLNIFGGCLIF